MDGPKVNLYKGSIQTFCGYGGMVTVWHGQGETPQAVIVECSQPDVVASVTSRNGYAFTVNIYNMSGIPLAAKTEVTLTWKVILPRQGQSQW